MVKKASFLLVILSVAILITSCGSYLDTKQSPEVRSEKVDLEVYEQLETKDKVSVIVKLIDNFDGSKLSESKIKIKENQDLVLNTLVEEDITLRHRYKTFNSFSGEISKEGLNKLANNENVESIYYDYTLTPLLADSIPQIHANSAWGLKNSNGTNVTGVGQTICIPDTGVYYLHNDLGGCFGPGCKVVAGYDFVNGDSDPLDDDVSNLEGHGTHVASIAASSGATSGSYVYPGGVAKNAKIAAVKVCNQGTPTTIPTCLSSNTLAGVDWCIDNKDNYNISVISISLGFGGGFFRESCPTWMDSELYTAVHNYKLPVVAASGNDGNKFGLVYPACNPNVISVGATYDKTGMPPANWSVCIDNAPQNDTIACGSSSSEELDLVAPGYAIRAPKNVLNSYSTEFGTSFSAPHVAGTIALMKQMNPTPSMTPEKILQILKSTGVPKVDQGNGLTFPRVDTYNAVLASKPVVRGSSSPLILKTKPQIIQEQI